MPHQATKITGRELVDNILQGERDFEHIQLNNFDFALHRRAELADYLGAQDLKENPLRLCFAELESVRADGLYIPFTKAVDVRMTNVSLQHSTLYGSDFWYGKFRNVNFTSSQRVHTDETGTYDISWAPRGVRDDIKSGENARLYQNVIGLGELMSDPSVAEPVVGPNKPLRPESPFIAFDKLMQRIRARL